MAVRSDCSASSGRTSKAGGVRRPARCSAASTSTISERRESSEPLICCSRASSGRSRASASPIRVSTLRTWAAMSISCALSLLRSWPIAAISALSFCCSSAALFCWARVGFEFLLALLDGVGRSGGGLRRRARRPGPMPRNGWQRRSLRTTGRPKAERERERSAASGRCQGTTECSALAASIRVVPSRARALALTRGDRGGLPGWSRPDKSVPEA